MFVTIDDTYKYKGFEFSKSSFPDIGGKCIITGSEKESGDFYLCVGPDKAEFRFFISKYALNGARGELEGIKSNMNMLYNFGDFPRQWSGNDFTDGVAGWFEWKTTTPA